MHSRVLEYILAYPEARTLDEQAFWKHFRLCSLKTLPTVLNSSPGYFGVIPAMHLCLDALKFFVSTKKRGDFVQPMLLQICQIVNGGEAGIIAGHRKDFLVNAFFITHVQRPDGPNTHMAAGKAGFLDRKSVV